MEFINDYILDECPKTGDSPVYRSGDTTSIVDDIIESLGGREKLLGHKQEVYQYTGDKYSVLSPDSLRKQIADHLKGCRLQKGESTKRYPITSRNLDDLAKLLYLEIYQETELPTWRNRQVESEIVPVANGLLRIDNLELLPHTPDYLSTHCLPLPYDVDAECPIWKQFLNEVYDEDAESIDALQQWFGYCLTPDTSQEKFLMLIGLPRSGKSTILEILARLLGEWAVCSLSITALESRWALAEAQGKLLIQVPDAGPSGGARLVETMKTLTGNDAVQVERKYRDPLTVRLTARVIIAANELPRWVDNSNAMKERVLIIPHTVSFSGKEDPNLKKRLRGELSGILNWALEGFQRYQENGVLKQPSAGLSWVEAFGQSSSSIADFLHTYFLPSSEGRIPVDALYEFYRLWCSHSGCQAVRKQGLLGQVKSVFPKVESKALQWEGRAQRCYVGLALKNPTADINDWINLQIERLRC